jgi:hypothetical protein
LVVVKEVNTAPLVGALPVGLARAPGSAIAFTATAADSDLVNGMGNILTYSPVGAPAGAVVHPDTGAFCWTPGDFNSQAANSFKVRVAHAGTPSPSDSRTMTASDEHGWWRQ